MKAEIISRIHEGRLGEVLPPPGDRMVRTVVLEQTIYDKVMHWKGMTDPKEADRWAQVYDELSAFIRGQPISLPKKPPRNKTARLAPLLPRSEEVWEFRHFSKFPQIRIFGRFAYKDCFVGLIWRNRDDLPENYWRIETVGTKTQWRNMFPSYEPLCQSTYKDPPYEKGDYDEYASNYILV